MHVPCTVSDRSNAQGHAGGLHVEQRIVILRRNVAVQCGVLLGRDILLILHPQRRHFVDAGAVACDRK